ncbi:MAG: ATP-binding cassette domain-containing protein [Mariprofundales bacterium]
MSLIQLQQITKAYGPHVLLDDVNLCIDEQHCIALIGRNGEGKSTLLRLLAQFEIADSGTIIKHSSVRLAFLEQMPEFKADTSVFDLIAESLEEKTQALQHYMHLLKQENVDMQQLAEAQTMVDANDGWSIKNRIDSLLTRLGIDGEAIADKLSGGWKRRVSLAQALVREPNLLLLDEPTNHLDIAAIEWLEQFVAEFNGTVIFVTHDRYFLDSLADEIIELDRGKIQHYHCDYDGFLKKKAELMAQESRQWRKFDKLLVQEEGWLRQGIPARRKRDEGRVRRLHDLRQQRSERRLHGSDISLHVASGIKAGKILIDARNISYSYTDTDTDTNTGDNKSEALIKDLSLRITAKERIGLLGPNGIGKSTLLNILLGKLTPQNGSIKHGAKLAIAMMDQMRELNPDDTLRDVLLPQGGQYVYIGGHEARHVVSYLEDFLFDRERLRARVKMLSGGERARVLLARLLLQPANILALDEPTNDLDIGTLAVLERALVNYPGCVLLISHDRAFMDRLVQRVLSFEGNGKIESITGNYSDYTAWKKKLIAEQKKTIATRQKVAKTSTVKKIKTPKKINKLSYKETRELELLPVQIEAWEEEQHKISAWFCQENIYAIEAEKCRAHEKRLRELEPLLEVAYSRWEALEQRLET